MAVHDYVASHVARMIYVPSFDRIFTEQNCPLVVNIASVRRFAGVFFWRKSQVETCATQYRQATLTDTNVQFAKI